MCLSERKFWYSNNYLGFSNHAVPLKRSYLLSQHRRSKGKYKTWQELVSIADFLAMTLCQCNSSLKNVLKQLYEFGVSLFFESNIVVGISDCFTLCFFFPSLFSQFRFVVTFWLWNDSHTLAILAPTIEIIIYN